MGTVTTVGRTLDRNLANVDEILQNGNNLFHGAQRAYDPNYNWLDLNLQLAPGVTGAYLAGPPARPAGRHLPAARDQPLQRPLRRGARHAHPVRQPVVGLLRPARQRHPDDHQHADRAEPARPRRSRCCSRASSRFENATQEHAGASTARRRRAASNAPKSSGPTTTTTTVPPTTTTTTQPCNLLTELLGCKAGPRGRARRARGRSSKSTGSGGGLGGLLSNKVTAATQNAAIATRPRRRRRPVPASPPPRRRRRRTRPRA